MWLLHTTTLYLESFEGVEIPSYAILSHRWEDQEVLFRDMRKTTSNDLTPQYGKHKEAVRDMWNVSFDDHKGLRKLRACCERARADDFEYVWIDTCCIDKSSSAELSEAINSMYQWYAQSEVCYVFLSDVLSESQSQKESLLVKSVWFERGWTLQELLAPAKLIFFDREWHRLGDKSELATAIQSRTGIPYVALSSFDPSEYCIAEKLSWAYERKTTRIEDRAYSLLGLFDINMPLLYGEGKKAFIRLQHELMREYNDTSIFLSSGVIESPFGMLATSPDNFHHVEEQMSKELFDHHFVLSKEGVSGRFRLYHYALDVYAVILNSDRGSGRWMNHAYIFVQWNFKVRQFQRVELGGQHYAIKVLKGINDHFAGEHEITIGRLPRVAISREKLARERIRYYLGWPKYSVSFSTSLFAVAGHFGRNSDSRKTMTPRDYPRTYFMPGGLPHSAIYSLTDKETATLEGQCLCIGGTGQRKTGEGAVEYMPTLILHHGFNLENRLVSFVSWLPCGPLRNAAWNPDTGEPCHISGHCWFEDPMLDSTEVTQFCLRDSKRPARYISDYSIAAYDCSRMDLAEWISVFEIRPPGGSLLYIVFWTPLPTDPDLQKAETIWTVWKVLARGSEIKESIEQKGESRERREVKIAIERTQQVL